MLQIDLQLIITNIANELLWGTNIDDLERHWNRKSGFWIIIFAVGFDCDAHYNSKLHYNY